MQPEGHWKVAWAINANATLLADVGEYPFSAHALVSTLHLPSAERLEQLRVVRELRRGSMLMN